MSLVSMGLTRREPPAFAIAPLANKLYLCDIRLYLTSCGHEKRKRNSASNPRYPHYRRE